MMKARDEIDLYEYLLIIWRWKWFVTGGVVLLMILSSVVFSLTSKYRSIGVLRLSTQDTQMSLPQYKTYLPTLSDPALFISFLDKCMSIPSSDLDKLKRHLRAMPDLEKNLNPVYAFGSRELQPGVAQLNPKNQYLLALELSFTANSPELARKVVKCLGSFVMHVIRQKILRDYVSTRYLESFTEVRKLRNARVEARFSLDQLQVKLADLRRISSEWASLDKKTCREIVSVDKGGYLFLPPSIQEIATEVAISEGKQKIKKIERDLGTNQVKRAFFGQFRGVMLEDSSKDLFQYFKKIKGEFFQNLSDTGEEVSIARNDILADYARFEYWFNDVMMFLSGPSLPKKAELSLTLVLGVTVVAGGFFLTLFAFLLDHIWKRNRLRDR